MEVVSERGQLVFNNAGRKMLIDLGLRYGWKLRRPSLCRIVRLGGYLTVRGPKRAPTSVLTRYMPGF
jgi:hypothetical protein